MNNVVSQAATARFRHVWLDDILYRRDISALVVIGGDGSQAGSHALSQMDFPIVGVASTIDRR